MWWEINSKQQILTKVNQKKIKSSRNEHACEHALNFDHWKAFSENFKPMRVSFWFVYKFTKNYCFLWLFLEFIQTKKRYPTFLDKIRIQTWKITFHIKLKFPLWTKLLGNLLLAKYLISVTATVSDVTKFPKWKTFAGFAVNAHLLSSCLKLVWHSKP